MAKCDFADNVKNVRGTLSKTVHYEHGQKIVKRVVAQVTPSGKQRIFIRQDAIRTTPYSDKEIAQQTRFKQAADYYYHLDETTKMAYAAAWKKNNHMFNGKKYATLRGFIIANYFAQNR